MQLEDPSKPWFEQPTDKARGYKLLEPYSNIFVGCDPRDGMTKASADSFDVFVNVSDSVSTTFEPSRAGQHMHWYPVNEMGLWNLSYLYWLKHVLDFHHGKCHRIYLHCHAGAYRSPSAALLWLQSRGHSPEEALVIDRDSKGGIYRIWKDHDNIPALRGQVFKLMNEHPTWSLGAILHHTGDLWNKEIHSGHTRKVRILHHYFWFYYKPKSWISGKKRWLGDWWKGNGWVAEGACSWHYKRLRFWSWPENAERKPDSRYQTEDEMKTAMGDHTCPGWDCEFGCKFGNPWTIIQLRYKSDDELNERIKRKRDENQNHRRDQSPERIPNDHGG